MELQLHNGLCRNLPKIEYRNPKSENGKCGIGNSRSRLEMRGEPSQKPALKFGMRGGPCHGVSGVRNQPQFNVSGRDRGNQLRMPWSNIPVRIAMYQQYRNFGMLHRRQRAWLQQVDSISKTRVQHC